MAFNPSYVLVTGATGFIGAHIVDQLLDRGVRVRGTARSREKADVMIEARPQHVGKLDFVITGDFSQGVVDLKDAVEGVDAVIHTASPVTYTVTNNETELFLPAINGVRSILRAAAAQPRIRRLIITSSFASVLDASKSPGPGFTYTGDMWNPITYEESIAPNTPPHVAYRGAKKFSEKEAWEFIEREKPGFDLVTLCPPMTFGPVVHPIRAASQLNESNARLWDVASGTELFPQSRVPVWIDVRDLAKVHVECLFREEAAMKRYVPAAREKFSYELAARIAREEFEWAREKVRDFGDVRAPVGYDLDGELVTRELGVEFRGFRETVVDLMRQVRGWEENGKRL